MQLSFELARRSQFVSKGETPLVPSEPHKGRISCVCRGLRLRGVTTLEAADDDWWMTQCIVHAPNSLWSFPHSDEVTTELRTSDLVPAY
jgi:hypothetical protein